MHQCVTKDQSGNKMIHAPTPANEKQRQHALHQLSILDTDDSKRLNHLVDLASEIAGTSISLISLVDSNRQWFKAKKGLTVEETDRDISFCGHAIVEDSDFLIVDDA